MAPDTMVAQVAAKVHWNLVEIYSDYIVYLTTWKKKKAYFELATPIKRKWS